MKSFVEIFVVFIIGLSACTSSKDLDKKDTEPSSEVPGVLKTQVENAIEGLDGMRSALASTIETDEVDAGTFAQVCKPVGMQARQIAQDNGWLVRQVATQYRNPANKADTEATLLSTHFMSEKDFEQLWFRTKLEGAPGWRYLHRITVEPACLACHGAKEERPEFVRTKYPDDTAFNFSEGDLRGLYSVFVPDDSTQQIEEPVQRVSPREFLSQKKVDTVVIDARTPTAYQESHLVGALNIDVRAADFVDKIKKLDRSSNYYLYCRTGNRSEQAGIVMKAIGFENVHNLGSLSELELAGSKIEKGN